MFGLVIFIVTIVFLIAFAIDKPFREGWEDQGYKYSVIKGVKAPQDERATNDENKPTS